MCNLIRCGHAKGRVLAAGENWKPNKELRWPKWEVATDVEIIKQVIKIQAKLNPSKQVRDLKSPQNWPNKHQTYFKPFILSFN